MLERTSIIVRDRKDPSKQVQFSIDFKKSEIGLVLNNGMELLVIDASVSKDIGISYVEETEKAKKECCGEHIGKPFDPATTILRNDGEIRLTRTDGTLFGSFVNSEIKEGSCKLKP